MVPLNPYQLFWVYLIIGFLLKLTIFADFGEPDMVVFILSVLGWPFVALCWIFSSMFGVMF